MRYIVREVEGYQIKPGSRNTQGTASPGRSVVVLDTLWNYRLCAEFATDRPRGTTTPVNVRTNEARAAARARCDELNRAHEEAVAA